MAIAYHSGSLGSDTTNADPAVITLGAISAGEYIIAGVVSDAIATLTSLPSGFSQLGSILDTTADNQSLLVARKASASGSEGALTFDMTQALIGVAIAFSGVDTTTPEDVAVVGVTDGASSGATGRTISASLTTVTNGCMLVAIAGTDVAASTDVTHTFATTAGSTAAWTIPTGGDIQDGFFNMAVGYALQSTAGAVTVRLTSTWAGGANAGLSLMLVALRPSGPAAPVLSAPTPSGTIATETTATVGATTDQTSGTFYAVVDSAANLSGVTATQIKAGQKASGSAALAANSAAVSTTTPSAGVTGLTAGTLYSYAAVQNNSNGDSNVVTGTFTTATYTLDQTKFRWRNDDGSETTATWAAAEDANVTIAALTPTRLRVEITATGDPASKTYRLQYRKVGETYWRDVN